MDIIFSTVSSSLNIRKLTTVNGNACYEIETTNESEECPAYWRKRKNDENI